MLFNSKRIIFGVLLILLYGGGYGQSEGSIDPLLPDVIPPSPTAASIAQYGELPVSYYTGSLNLSIPLHNAQGRSLEVPISLSYNSSGCKVDALASWVGDGWAAQAGGVISRTLRGMEDERPGVGYWAMDDSIPDAFPNQSDFLQWQPSDARKRDLAEGFYDAQPDMFSFNFLNYAGKFMIAPDGKVYGMPANRLQVEFDPLPSPSLDWFKVTTPDGNIFLFEDVEATVSESVCGGSSSFNTYNSSWYLSKIISADRLDTVFFTYGTALIKHPINRSETDYQLIGSQSGVGHCTPKAPSICYSIVETEIKYLKEIKTLRESISFHSNGNRLDIYNARMLDSVVVQRNGLKLKSFHFGHTYFQTQAGLAASSWPTGGGIDRFKRLKLNSLYEASATGERLPAYLFDYNQKPIAPYGCFAIDHWGYFNGKANPHLRPEMKLNGNTWYGANREVDVNFSVAGMLEKITYPAGGFITFEYEGNDFGQSRQSVGGMRIRKQTVHDGTNPQNDIVKSYTYNIPNNPQNSSGTILTLPHYLYQVWELEVEHSQSGSGSSTPYVARECLHWARGSSSKANLAYTKGSPVGYAFVTETWGKNGIGGKSVMKFRTGIDIAVMVPPFTPSGGNDHKRGQMLAKWIYDASGALVQKEENTYSDSLVYQMGGAVCSYRKKHVILDPGYQEFFFEKFFVNSEWVFPTAHRIVQYDPVSQDSFVQLTTLQYDNPTHFLPTRTFKTLSDGRISMQKKKYAADYESTVMMEIGSQLTIGNLLAKNMVETVVEEQHWEGPDPQNLSLISGKVNVLSDFSNQTDPDKSNIKPYAVWALETESPITYSAFSPREHFNAQSQQYEVLIPDFSFDNMVNDYVKRAEFHFGEKGNLLEQKLEGGAPTSYVWNEGAYLPVAKVINASADEIAFTGFESVGNNQPGGFTIIHSGSSGGWQQNAFVGQNSFQLSGKTLKWTAPSGSSNSYTLSFWTNGGTFNINKSNSSSSQSGPNGWELKEFTFSLGAGQSVELTGSGIIDEVRLLPIDAILESSYSYDQKERVTHTAGPEGQAETFEYDTFNRLQYIQDVEGNYRQSILYYYKR
jgi:hypothetical protein